MSRRLDMVALALLWTGAASYKPRRRCPPPAVEARSPDAAAGPEGGGTACGPVPPETAVRDLLDLEAALAFLGVGDIGAQAADLRARASSAIAAGESSGLGLVLRGDAEYPPLLAEICDPPPALWTSGALDPGTITVAIVGSRAATLHGLEMGYRLGHQLARAGVTVVSGLARGVDAAAHRGALSGGGQTIAVLGCGADIVYPAEHADLARQIGRSGALLSEFPPGTPPRAWHFPRRNRLISGLCQGVVVVEASDHSGSLITARLALEQGRDVMAVPGGVLSGRNKGAHALLRDGARVVEDAGDILEELGLTRRARGDDEEEANMKAPDPLLRAMLPGEPYGLEALSELSGLDPVPLLARLAQLELAGWIQRAGGGRFVKAGGNVLR